MSVATPFTTEIAHAQAANYLAREEQFYPPAGTPFENFIIGNSHTFILDILHLGDAEVFHAAFMELVRNVKSSLRDEFTKSAWADSHREVGFQFIVYPCDERGERAINLASNSFVSTPLLALKARMFAKEK